jgi:hypothetical protein
LKEKGAGDEVKIEGEAGKGEEAKNEGEKVEK